MASSGLPVGHRGKERGKSMGTDERESFLGIGLF